MTGPRASSRERPAIRVWTCVDVSPLAGRHHDSFVHQLTLKSTKEIQLMIDTIPIVVPNELAASHSKHDGAAGRAWIARLPSLAAQFLDRWTLRLDGPPLHGAVALVLPVICADGMPAALKLTPVNEENVGEPIGLRMWNGDGVVHLLDHDEATGTMLLERLDASRPLSTLEHDIAATQILAELMARMVAVPPHQPSGG